MFNRYPEARYRLTQLAFVQEHALAEAQNRLQQMEAALQQAQQAAQQAAQQPQQGGGFFSGLFGGGQRAAPPPQPGPVWNHGAAQPQGRAAAGICPAAAAIRPGLPAGTSQRGGSGSSAGVDHGGRRGGGMVVGNALMGRLAAFRS